VLSRRGEGEVNERDVSGSPGDLFVTIEVGRLYLRFAMDGFPVFLCGCL
jgi:hypothetical protein